MSIENPTFAAGDLLFYLSQGDMLGWLIATWTRSPFIHVAICLDETYKVEAVQSGVQKALIRGNDYNTLGSHWQLQANSKDHDPIDLSEALSWLQGMVGQSYGIQDFLTNANPFEKFFYVVSPLHYDCSALATQFLVKAGGVNLCGYDLDPHTVTPADLATCLGVKG